MTQGNKLRVGAGLVLLSVSSAMTIHGQSPNGSLSGTIHDAAGGVIPGATVTIVNTATGTSEKVVTSASGAFRVPDLIPGTYEMDVVKDGFKKTIKTGIELHVQGQVAIDQALEIGSVSESITVEAGAPTIDVESATVGQVIEGRQVEEMPLNGHNVLNLMSLVTGVVPQGTTSGTALANQGGGTFTNPAGWGNYQIGGAVAGWNAIFLDGEPLNVSNQNWLSLVPTQESIGEFRVDTSAVSPQYGRFAGGVINYSTKSGANAFHGSVYESFRNTALNAQTFFGNRSGLPKAVLIQNQYGASLGGPIKRDKTFFFFSWEGIRRIGKLPTTALVPSTANLNGDFSATAATKPIIDPATGQQFTCNGQLNVICANRADPAFAAMRAVHYFQLPNTTSGGTAYNLAVLGVNRSGADQYVARVDQQVSEKQRLFGRYTRWSIDQQQYNTTSSILNGSGVTSRTNQVALGDSYTFSQSLVGDVRGYYNRFIYVITPTGAGNPNLAQLGGSFAGIAAAEPYKSYPGVNLTGYASLTQLVQAINHDIFGLSVSATKTAGRHSITAGGEARRIEWYNINNTLPGGMYYFNGSATANAAVAKQVGASTSGDPVADFYLGAITPQPVLLSNSGGAVSLIQVSGNTSTVSYYQGYYVTDSFRASPKLNFNVGVRYELPGSWFEKKYRDTVLQPNAASPLGTITNPATNQRQALTGILAPVNTPLAPYSGEVPAHLGLFDPRVGVNYSPTSSMAIRAGFGISQPTLDAGSNGPSISPVNQALTAPTGPLSNPFPNGFLGAAGHNLNINQPYSQYPGTLAGSVVASRMYGEAYPTVYQYNATVQQSMGAKGTFELAYVGSHGSHMPTPDTNINQIADQYLSLGSALLATPTSNPFAGLLSPTSAILKGSFNTVGQFLRPFPQFVAVNSSSPWRGNVSYNAFQAKTQRQFGASSILVSYTWAKQISDFEGQNAYLEGQTVGTPQNFHDFRSDRSEANFDVRHRLVISYILDLPFGKGKKFLNQGGGIDRAVGGWSLSGITTLATGFPLAMIYGPGTAVQQYFGGGQARPNYSQGCAKQTSGSAFSKTIGAGRWFNTACFTAPNNYGFGNAGRVDNQLRTQGPANWDMTLRKATRITERVSADLRAEYFNVFNRVQFGAPSTSAGTGAYGTISTQLNNPRQLQLSLALKF